MTNEKRVWLFREGNAQMRNLLGGKGANLAEMTNAGLPVPPGLTITTETCMDYINNGNKMPDGLMDEVRKALDDVESQTGKKFGDSTNPLLVSVRSGARLSMPGMMETILNLGLNDETVEAMVKLTNNPRFCYDSYRRFLTMFGSVAWDMDRQKYFESEVEKVKEKEGVKEDTQISAEGWKSLIPVYKNDGITVIGEFVISAPDTNESGIQARSLYSATSSKKFWTVGSRTYYGEATINLSKAGTKYASSSVSLGVESGTSVAAGNLGIRPYVVNAAGTIVASKDTSFNSSDGCKKYTTSATYSTSSGTYRAYGHIFIWNGTSYKGDTTYNSPYLNF